MILTRIAVSRCVSCRRGQMTDLFEDFQYTDEQNRSLSHFNRVSDYWHDIYQDERSFAGYVLRKQEQFILDLVRQTPGAQHILDVGCGAGVTALKLAQRGYAVSGLDIAPRMIQRAQDEARQRRVECDFRVG